MSALSEKLKKSAERNFCEKCYQKYLALIHSEVEYLLSEPISDWRLVEANINGMVMKAKGFYKKTNSTVITPDTEAFNEEMRKERWGFKRKIDFLQKQGIIKESLHGFLDRINKIRNRVHKERTEFSKQDYVLFREAKALTDAILWFILFDLKDDRWKNVLANVEKRAKQVLSKLNSKPDTKLGQQT